MDAFNGLGMTLGNLSLLSRAKTRLISAESHTGEKGRGAMAEPGPERGTQPTAPFAQIASLPVSVNPFFGLNCFWEMPFQRSCRITVQNINPGQATFLYYQINYTLTHVPGHAAYFHAQFRRVNPLPKGEVYTGCTR